MCPYCGNWLGGGAGGLGLILSILFMVALLAGIGLLIWWFIKQAGRGNGASSQPSNRALNILDERYAKGELDKEEYEERRRALNP